MIPMTGPGGSDKLWGGRFSTDVDETMLRFSESTEADGEMIAEDIWGSEAHALMLHECGINSTEHTREILRWLETARKRFEAGELELKVELEDVHMNVESFLREGAGPEAGGRLHTARSRNDQVVTDFRMRLRQYLLEVRRGLAELREVLLELAEQHAEHTMPGFTHTQHAQPITAGFWLAAHAAGLERDEQRLAQAYLRTNQCPLGGAALAGTSFPTDRELTARLLGFDGVVFNAMDAVQSRDFAVESVAALTMLMVNLSRMAEEVVLFSSPAFGMLEVDDAFATGSSIMPQKKNPCAGELSRARTAAVAGRLMELVTLLKALPSGYNRDLQNDKPPVWEACRHALDTVEVMVGMWRSMTLKTERMAELAGAEFASATELANHLVRERGMPFRDCHELIGSLVGRLLEEDATLDDHERVAQILSDRGQPMTPEQVAEVVDPAAVVRAQESLGSTNPDEVRRCVEQLRCDLAVNVEEIEKDASRLREAREETARRVRELLSE
ncbi:MAG: argininosuccinate lyase [Armatimonadota bacterium]|nr:argininosuccinate lyase [Armatimonadota bacterium]